MTHNLLSRFLYGFALLVAGALSSGLLTAQTMQLIQCPRSPFPLTCQPARLALSCLWPCRSSSPFVKVSITPTEARRRLALVKPSIYTQNFTRPGRRWHVADHKVGSQRRIDDPSSQIDGRRSFSAATTQRSLLFAISATLRHLLNTCCLISSGPSSSELFKAENLNATDHDCILARRERLHWG